MLIQEAYLAFFEAYDKVDWNLKVSLENGAAVWAYLKKSTV